MILFFPPEIGSASSASENLLQGVSSELSEGKLTVRFEFSEPVLNRGKPVFDRTFVRVNVPRAFVRPTKRFYYTGDSRIPQIFVSQLDPGSLQLQFVLGEQLPNLRENFQVEDQGRSLVFHFFKKEEDVLSEFLTRAANREEPPNVQETKTLPVPDERTIQNLPDLLEANNKGFILDQVAAESPAPVASSEQKIPSTPSLRFEENKERDSGGPMDPVSITVKTFTMFALVLALMFLVFYLFKKFVLKNTIFGGNEKFVRVLGTGFLGPKKNIVLVEVVGEILVLGTSNDNISLLTHIQDKEKIEKIKAFGKEMNGKKFWNPQKGNDPVPEPINEPSKPQGEFANYLKQFSGAPSEKEKSSVEEVTELIRKNLGKLKAL
ncbi:MAG: flagellar biosynthetic protein FliO [Nitrospinae bacterium]|nr:flagellar biosynthetic protein FliO [Nitrospinota bacterium]